MRPPGRVVERSFYEGDSLEVAPRLLNKLLARCDVAGRVVEVEAYHGADDPASHAFRGPTARNRTMFGPPGRLYVYFTYGMHFCANVVTGPQGVGQAVLLRALAPVEGLDAMRARRYGGSEKKPGADSDLLSGPARLCQGLGITRVDDGADLVGGDRGIVLLDDGVPPPDRPGTSGRVGIRLGTEAQWRWWVAGEPNVSKGRPGPGRERVR